MKKILINIFWLYCCLMLSYCNSENRVHHDIKVVDDNSISIKKSLKAINKIKSCDTIFTLVDVISITNMTDEQESYGVLYHKTNDKGEIISMGNRVKVPADFFVPNTFLKKQISKNALRYLAEYLDRKCECLFPVKSEDSIAYRMYSFNLIQGKQSKTCYISLKDFNKAIDYFKELKIWLENSKYIKEFSELLEFIDGQIKYIEDEKLKQK
ncbi:MAG TPA: hypothetical protein PKX92_01360 [Edaphocola sp.]|nr:hypothetical protein [Edaphocola sp.]